MFKMVFNVFIKLCLFILVVLFFIFFYFRYIVFVESSIDLYSSVIFFGFVDGMFEIEGGMDEERWWEIVKKYFSVVFYIIDFVIFMLWDVFLFMLLFDGF